jgi:eukaryotic-like serine/threonine-protein kinase
MGEVYRATDTALERTVAVKVLSDRYARQDDARARFRREALAAARLSATPNVVTVFDVAEHDGRPLIVMEYLEGGSVYERLRAGRIPRGQALTWLEQAANALDRAHASGIVHRDVKPANLLLDRDGNVHVSDFGIASASGADMLTEPGTVLGTAGYISPEQARGEPATSASDRYSLAVVAFELLTGRRPFGGDTPTTEAFAHLNASVPRVGDVDPTQPLALDSVFDSALAKDPSQRPGTARELVRRLREALDDAPVTVAAPTKVLEPQPRVVPTRRIVRREHHARGRRVWLAALVAFVLLGLGLGVAALVTAGDGFPPPQTSAQDARRSEAASTSQDTTTRVTTTAEPEVDGAALNRDGFARMQAGDFAGALPLLRESVLALKGSNTLDEAYASYNLAYSRFVVGRCDGVVGLLDRSERIQGHRSEIDELRRQWEKRCAPGEDGEVAPPGDGHGKAKGHKKGDGGEDG